MPVMDPVRHRRRHGLPGHRPCHRTVVIGPPQQCALAPETRWRRLLRQVSTGYRIVLAESRLSAQRPWAHLRLTMTDAPFDWLHMHEALELGICLDGQGVWVVGQRHLAFAAGSVVVIAPGIPHFAHCHAGTISRWEFLMVEPSLLLQGHQPGREVLDGGGFAGPAFPVMLDPRAHADACLLVREAVFEAGRALPGHQVAVRGLCWAALARLRRLPGAGGRGVEARALAAVRPALERVARTDLPPPATTELARLCGLSETTLRRQFRRGLGMNTKAWLDRNRVLRAADRLRDPRASILDVALESGFASGSGFARQFHAVMGMSPRTWRGQGLAKSARS